MVTQKFITLLEKYRFHLTEKHKYVNDQEYEEASTSRYKERVYITKISKEYLKYNGVSGVDSHHIESLTNDQKRGIFYYILESEFELVVENSQKFITSLNTILRELNIDKILKTNTH